MALKALFFISLYIAITCSLIYPQDSTNLKYILPTITNRADSNFSADTSTYTILSSDDDLTAAKDSTQSGLYFADEQPLCINLREIYREIKYPESARDNEIEGKVHIMVLVGLNGEVIKTGAIYGPVDFYKEVKRVSMMLKFNVIRYKGDPVKCWVPVPFNFILK